MRKRVICDTMIWYEIGEGKINIDKLKGVDLIATGNNIQEISSTENLLSEVDLVKKALKALESHNSEIIEYEPWDYLLTFHVKVDYHPISRESYLSNLKTFEFLIDGIVDNELSDVQKLKELNELIKAFNEPIQTLTKTMNEGLIKVREKGAEKYGSRKAFVKHLQGNDNSFWEIMEMFKDIFASKLNLDRSELDNKIDWNNFELLFRTWDLYFKEKTIVSNSKFHENDFYDLTNMAYVGQGDFYWTLETNPWVRIMKSNDVTKKYVFEYEH